MSVPALRFRNDDGLDFPDWEEATLGEVCDIKRGASPRPIADKKWFSHDSTIGWVRISDVSKSSKYLTKTEQYLSEAGIKKSRLVKKGNIIMSICATIGKPIYTNFDVCIHDGFVVFENLQIDHEYLYYYLMLIEKNWYQYGQPGSQVNLNSDIVSNETIPIPDIKEQTKIANFLTAVDEKITQLTQKHALLTQYRKGVMQQIFSQELRFKDDDGEDFPEWKVKKLGDIADLTSSKRVYLSDYVKEGIPFYRGKEISELKRNEKPKDILYITRKAYEGFKASFGVPKVNDILITAVGTLGNVYRVKDNSEFYFKDGNLIWLRDIKISSAFLEILFATNNEAVQKSSIGSSQRALTIIELKKLKFNVPSLAEQTKIANFLTVIDDKITNTQTQLKAMKQYKQGLLQQMFV